MKRLLIRWGPALGIMLIIFLFSSQAKGTLPDFGGADFGVKKFSHAFIYALLAIAMLWGVRDSRPVAWRHVAAAFVLTVLYAMTDEYHQTFVAGRDGQLFDVGVDAVGATIGLALRLWLWPPLAIRLRAVPFLSKSESNRR